MSNCSTDLCYKIVIINILLFTRISDGRNFTDYSNM